MADIVVEFTHQDRRAFSPGDRVEGELVITTHKPLKCKNVLAKLQCTAHGYGNTTSKDIESTSVFMGELPAGIHRFPFSFELPAGPYTYHGHYTNLEWGVQGYLDIPWAIDKKHFDTFMLLNRQLPAHIIEVIPEQPDAHKHSSGFGWLGCGGILALVAGLLGLITIMEDGDMICFALGAALPAAIFLFVGMRAFLASRVIHTPHITLDPWPIRPGQASLYRFTFTPGSDLTLNSVVVELKCKEVVVRGHGTDSTTHTHEVYSDIFTLNAGEHHPKGKPVELAQEILIPDHVPASFELPSNRVVWTIETRVDIPNWPDWKDSHALHVAASHTTPTPEPDPPGVAW